MCGPPEPAVHGSYRHGAPLRGPRRRETATTRPADNNTPPAADALPQSAGKAASRPRGRPLIGPGHPLAPVIDAVIGVLAATIVVLFSISEFMDAPTVDAINACVTVALLAVFSLTVPPSRLAFVAVGVALSIAALVFDPDGIGTIRHGLRISSFVIAFFAALCTLRVVADTSPGIRRCGRFLAQQPPGRRYLALTAGGQLFALLLNYGAIALLGSLATQSAREEKNAEIRSIRIRRMLLAIQRGFVSVLPWSPLSFAVAISTTLLPGTSWGGVLLPSLVSGALLAGIGYGLDTVFKPRLSGPRPPVQHPTESWTSLAPLLLLLVLLMGLAGSLHLLTGIRIVGLVIIIVPIVSFGWAALQARLDHPVRTATRRSADFVTRDLPAYRGEMTLLAMASYIGTAGAHLLLPLFESAGFDLNFIPTPLLLVLLVFLIPVAGQFGMNPILAVSLFGPLLPSAAELGITPTALLLAITAGWAITGATSPFTATTLLIGTLSNNTAFYVGMRWNGFYALACAVLLSVWVLIYAYLL